MVGLLAGQGGQHPWDCRLLPILQHHCAGDRENSAFAVTCSAIAASGGAPTDELPTHCLFRQHLPSLALTNCVVFVCSACTYPSCKPTSAAFIPRSSGAHLLLFVPPTPAVDPPCTLQANQAHSVAFVLRTCGHELPLRSEPAIYITDACTAMEMSDAAISATASFRGAPVKTEAIVRLRTACLQVLSAAIGWQAFRWGRDDARRGACCTMASCCRACLAARLPASAANVGDEPV
jgi:hypothetical protein